MPEVGNPYLREFDWIELMAAANRPHTFVASWGGDLECGHWTESGDTIGYIDGQLSCEDCVRLYEEGMRYG